LTASSVIICAVVAHDARHLREYRAVAGGLDGSDPANTPSAAIAAAGPNDTRSRALDGAFFDDVYQRQGYDAASNMTPAEELVLDIIGDSAITSVLHVGCAHGAGVELLWNHSLVASGVDFSPAAVRRAQELRLPLLGAGRQAVACVAPCFAALPLGDPAFRQTSAFRNSSVGRLPYADRAFDAVMATGVLEYLDKAALEKLLAEFSRVAKNSMYMNISSKSYNATRCRSDVITCKTLRWWRDTVEIQTNLTCEIGLRKELVCERALRPVAPRLMKYASYCALVPIILLMVFWFPREDGVKFLA